jgi:hypothetical protein
MKQDEIGFDVERNGDFKSSKFGIKTASDMVHIFSVLRSKLYSDKVLAVCREYATNACDAHIDAGIPDTPIQITLPNHSDLFFRVRDFGRGLDEDGIREVYCMYGASTKRNSNAFNGQMGFGSKSAFAYTDFWQINSHCNGTKICYSIFLDESGLGEVSELSREPTSETGIEIVIPVYSSDVHDFHSRARNLYRWFRVKPTILGASVELDIPEIHIDLGDVKIAKHRLDNPIAIMGNVGYPVDIGKLLHDSYDSKVNANRLNAADSDWLRWRCSNLIMSFEIGELQMAASREALEYKDSTVKAIIKKLAGIRDRATAKVTTEVLAQTNLRQAIRKAQELNYISSDGIECVVNGDKIKWQGKDWECRPTVDDFYFSSIVEVFRSGSRFAARPADVLGKEKISPVQNTIILLDVERAVGVARAKNLAAELRTGVTMLVPAPTKVEESKTWLGNNLPQDLWVLASTLPDPVMPDASEDDDRPLVRPRKAPSKVDAAKRAAIYFTTAGVPHERSAKSKNWTPVELDETKLNLIIPMESFAPKDFVENMEPRAIAADFASLVTAGVLPKNACLLAVRTSDIKEATDAGCKLLSTELRDVSEKLSKTASLFDGINSNEEQKRVLVWAKRAGTPMFFDPETTEGKNESAAYAVLRRSRLGRNLGLDGDYISSVPSQTSDACRNLFPLLKLLNLWQVDRGSLGKDIVEYMRLINDSRA